MKLSVKIFTAPVQKDVESLGNEISEFITDECLNIGQFDMSHFSFMDDGQLFQRTVIAYENNNEEKIGVSKVLIGQWHQTVTNHSLKGIFEKYQNHPDTHIYFNKGELKDLVRYMRHGNEFEVAELIKLILKR